MQVKKTAHPLIFKAIEQSCPINYLLDELEIMKNYLEKNDKKNVLGPSQSLYQNGKEQIKY